jgi:hypothetical protein
MPEGSGSGSNDDAATPQPNFFVSGTLRIRAGNIVCVSFGTSFGRQMAKDSVPRGALENKGFDKTCMKLVVPSTPRKPNSPDSKSNDDKWKDYGLHLTISYHGITKNKAGTVDDITEAMEEHNGKSFDFCMDTNNMEFYIGNALNDESVGAAFYVSYKLISENKLVNEVRDLLGLGKASSFLQPEFLCPDAFLSHLHPCSNIRGVRGLIQRACLCCWYCPDGRRLRTFPKAVDQRRGAGDFRSRRNAEANEAAYAKSECREQRGQTIKRKRYTKQEKEKYAEKKHTKKKHAKQEDQWFR